ncbi:methionine adenosyltransferase 2 subunit beta-like isoform X2 [Daktulosphaira vitifoliae]|uniref:methionine adenosyltransferase 2 subunit beta-like isoform X2 n=1 Tax=Daktulosphaira vitifoliae TaxID=58002 RepID=UPI0021AA8A4A|nr:methionine adenosyltransferase 2 subunit beta-like isoform X2 [Daktulosphaira vitifoliae]
MKVVVTGASGLLGRSIYERFTDEKNWSVFGTAFKRAQLGLNKLNLLNKKEVSDMLNTVKPDIIIHCAAERFPDKVESDPQTAYDLNVGVTAHLANEANQLNIPLLYISTDYVFDGKKSPYKESDEPSPINEYGKLKLLGEKKVLSANSKNIVLRIPILYGTVETLEESAVTILFKGLKKSQQQNEFFKVSNYELRNPSNVKDIAHIVFKLTELKLHDVNDINGIFHWCGKEVLTKTNWCSATLQYLSGCIPN